MPYMKLNRPWGALIVAAALSTGISEVTAAPPQNDAIEGAVPIRSLPFQSSVDATEATSVKDDPIHAGKGATVWYVFTPSADVRVLVDTLGSNCDTTLSVHTGFPGALRQVAWDDDGGSEEGQSRLVFEAKAGATYHIMVGAAEEPSGKRFVLSAKVGPPPLQIGLSLDPEGSLDPSTGVAIIHGKLTCSHPSVVGIFGDMTQRTGRANVGGAVFTYVVCDGDAEWSAEVSGTSVGFGGGSAHITATASGYSQSTGEYADSSTSADVYLRSR